MRKEEFPNQTVSVTDVLTTIVGSRHSRLDLWRSLLAACEVRCAAEIGVWEGDFASEMLCSCPSIATYYMIDPWAHLEEWNKPFNVSQEEFEQVYRKAMDRTAFAADRRKVLRGKALDVIDRIPDRSLDFAYVDGDHTLQGITADLIGIFPKMKPGAIIGGDDFRPTPWSQGVRFEPTLVFPFAVHFALAIRATVYALPFEQFLIVVPSLQSREPSQFVDLTGEYRSLNLRDLLVPPVRTALSVWRHRLFDPGNTPGTLLRKKKSGDRAA
jgi:hypothetical protein